MARRPKRSTSIAAAADRAERPRRPAVSAFDVMQAADRAEATSERRRRLVALLRTSQPVKE